MVKRNYLAQDIGKGFLEEAMFEVNNCEVDENIQKRVFLEERISCLVSH